MRYQYNGNDIINKPRKENMESVYSLKEKDTIKGKLTKKANTKSNNTIIVTTSNKPRKSHVCVINIISNSPM